MNAIGRYFSNQTLESVNSSSTVDNDPTYQKCNRKGKNICYTKKENIAVINQSLDQNSHRRESGDTEHFYESSSEQLSGESAYKTYIFEENQNDSEIEKCIEFWKGVMEKNLKPIKCTIINNKKRKKENKIEVEEEKTSNTEEINAAIEQAKDSVHEEYRQLLIQSIKEIHRLKLEKVKLIGKSRCKVCDALDSPLEEYSTDKDKETIKKEVENLNNWKSTSAKKRLGGDSDQEINCSDSLMDEQETELPAGKEIKLDRSTGYQFINVIEKKKQDGTYDEWRKNLVKTICPCGKVKCECNTNPAIKSIKQMQVMSDRSLGVVEREVIEERELPMGTCGDIQENEKLLVPYIQCPIRTSETYSYDELNRATILPTREFEHHNMNLQIIFETVVSDEASQKDEYEQEQKRLQEDNGLQEEKDIEEDKDLQEFKDIFPEEENFPDSIDTIPLESNSNSNASSISSTAKKQVRASTGSTLMERTVSMVLPSGEVEILKRESVEDTDWEIPTKPVYAGVSLQNTKSSLDTFKKKFNKRLMEENSRTDNIEEWKADTEERKSSIRERKSGFEERKSEFEERKSSIRERKSSIRERKSEFEERKSSIRERVSEPEERQSAIVERKSQNAEQKSSIGERKSEPRERKSHTAEQKSSIGARKSEPKERKSQTAEQKSSIGERKSEPRERKSSIGARKSEPKERKSSIGARKSEPKERKSSIGARKSEPKERKSQTAEQKSSIGEHKSEPREQKSHTAEQKSSIGERKSEPRERKFKTVESFANGDRISETVERRSTSGEPNFESGGRRSTNGERNFESRERRSTNGDRKSDTVEWTLPNVERISTTEELEDAEIIEKRKEKDSIQLELLHRRATDPYEVSTIFFIPP